MSIFGTLFVAGLVALSLPSSRSLIELPASVPADAVDARSGGRIR
jgi:hypothetical protein